MSSYDSVYVECPDCGDAVDFQSKAGECSDKAYYAEWYNSIPLSIIGDLVGKEEKCMNCGTYVSFPLRLVVVYEGDCE